MTQHWPFSVDWVNGVIETLEWRTGLLTSPVGAEQRFAARLGPRRTLDVPFVVTGQERAYLDLLMMQSGGGQWLVPMAHEAVQYGPVAAGQNAFAFDTAHRELFVGGHVILRDDSLHAEALGIASVTANGITTASGARLAYRWPTLTPAMLGLIPDIVTSQRETAQVLRGTIRFQSQEPALWPPTTHTPAVFPTYSASGVTLDAYPVLLDAPNAIAALDYGYERKWKKLDNDTGFPVLVDTAARGFPTQKYSWFLSGAAQQARFRDLLYQLAGRRGPIWVPTFNDDLAAAAGYVNPQGIFTVIPGRERILSAFADGTFIIGGTAPDSVGDGIPPEVANAGSLLRTSFVSLKRLAADLVEIMHNTDRNGLATASLVFHDAPDLRQTDGLAIVL